MKIHTHPTHAELDAFVIAFAKKHGVTAAPTRFTALAKLYTELSGDEVLPQTHIERLLIELTRAKVIDGRDMLILLGMHFENEAPGDR
jgi:hypothetical protein